VTDDETAIRTLIDRWSKAVRDGNMAEVCRDHADDLLMFDVPLPFQSRGLDAYMQTWDTFYALAEHPVKFDFTHVEVTAGADVAFATATGHCVTTDEHGTRLPLDFRLTMGLRKQDGRWIITHEHHSIPAE
jgi:uncharacterized protein (TIGR02246 family)